MHSTRHDPDQAALHASSRLPGHVLDVIVLTNDEGLLATLREASGPEHALWRAVSADAAVDLLVGGRCGVLICDLGALRGDVSGLIDRLHAQFPELVLLATGKRDEENTIGALISSGVIYRFLHKPVSPARAGLFLTAATRRYQELRETQEPLALTTVRTIAARPHMGKYAVIALVVIVALLIWLFWRTEEAPAPIIVPQASVQGATTAEQIADYIARGQIAFATGRLAEPRGDNALEYFQAVLMLQPADEQARVGVARVIAALERRFSDAVQARSMSQANAALAALERADPNYPRRSVLRNQLAALQSALIAPAAAPTINPAAADELAASIAAEESVADNPSPAPIEAAEAPERRPEPDQLAQVAALRERGSLIAPEGANAFDLLASLLEQFPEAEEVRAEQQRLTLALLEHARTALAAKQLDEARALLTRAESLAPGVTATRSLQQQLAAAQEAQDFSRRVVSAASLKRVREVPPAYPREAQRQGLEGWVDVEFTIAPDGATRDLTVRGGERLDVFASAALDCVRQWRFAPIVRNGAPVAQRAVLRVRFALKA